MTPPTFTMPSLFDEAPEADRYKYDPVAWCRDILGIELWASGDPDRPGQVEIAEHYALVLRQQHEKQAWENGSKFRKYWDGGTIKNWIRIEGGHGVGKTALSSLLVLHFVACFQNVAGYTFAPSDKQLKSLFWTTIRKFWKEGLRGHILPSDSRYQVSPLESIQGRVVAAGKDTGMLQGLHTAHKIFVVDEATDVGGQVFNSLVPLTSSGICIVFLLANPSNRVCRFHKVQDEPQVKSYRQSCLDHPNVVQGRDVIPGGIRRDWVDQMIDRCTEIVPVHSPDRYTFTVPWRPEEIRAAKQDSDGDVFLFRVQGIAPGRSSATSIVAPARLDAARKRTVEEVRDNSKWITIGVDASRFGTDKTVACSRFQGVVRWFAHLDHNNRDGAPTIEMLEAIREHLRQVKGKASQVFIRVDAGYGGGIIDMLRSDWELGQWFTVVVSEVNFGGSVRTDEGFADRATELYVLGARELDQVRLENIPERLEADLTDRTYGFVQKRVGASYRTLRKLEDKDGYKKRRGHSPDDGDAWALAILPPEIFGDSGTEQQVPILADQTEWWNRDAVPEWQKKWGG